MGYIKNYLIENDISVDEYFESLKDEDELKNINNAIEDESEDEKKDNEKEIIINQINKVKKQLSESFENGEIKDGVDEHIVMLLNNDLETFEEILEDIKHKNDKICYICENYLIFEDEIINIPIKYKDGEYYCVDCYKIIKNDPTYSKFTLK